MKRLEKKKKNINMGIDSAEQKEVIQEHWDDEGQTKKKRSAKKEKKK